MFGAVNDSASIEHKDVEAIVRKLCVSYADVRRSFLQRSSKITKAIETNDVTEAVRLMVKVYRLPPKFLRRVGYSAKMQPPAALHTQFDPIRQQPLSGVMYFQASKQSLGKEPTYRLVHIIAHELAHARMQFDRHSLKRSEFATDVLAVLVSGDSAGYQNAMVRSDVQYGYIRRDLLQEVFRCLNRYSAAVYLK